MQIVLICGSIAQRAHTRVLLREVEAQLRGLNVGTTFWDLRERPLPIADPAYHAAPHTHPDSTVRCFISHLQEAEGIVLGSPLYHGSFSGALKNALDHLGYDAFRNKVVALVSHGSGIRSCAQPAEQLRTIVRTLYGYSTQTQVATTNTDYEERVGDIALVNVDILERVQRLAGEMVQLLALLGCQDIIKED